MNDEARASQDGERAVQDRLGELLIVGFPGTEWTPEIESELRRIRPAGVIFFAANFPDASTAARLCRAVHATLGSPAEPPLVCADEEGGMVSQISGFWEVPPSARAVAASGGPPLVKDLAQRTARRLLALGVNLDFAPVLDIHSNPLNPVIGIRSFGTAASQVTACGRAAVEGMEAAGIIPVVKHFPGHGDTTLDSHVDLPRVEADSRILALRELRPFEAAVAWGAPVVMVAHVVVPALDPDPERPATLSPPIVTETLRGRMGFQGVVVTDALEMAGATTRGSFGEVAVRAIEAGSDLLLYSKLHPGPDEALVALREALRTGRLTEARVLESLSRLRRLRVGSAARPRDWGLALEREARDLITHEELERVADGAIRILRQGAGGIPLKSPVDVLEINRPTSRAGMSDLLRAHGMTARERETDPATWPRGIEGSALLTIAVRGSTTPDQEALGRAWLKRFPETVTVASLNPHATDGWPEVRTLLVTFDNMPATRRALARRLAVAATLAKAQK
jgi:beta-N-acetylhexosaminidase